MTDGFRLPISRSDDRQPAFSLIAKLFILGYCATMNAKFSATIAVVFLSATVGGIARAQTTATFRTTGQQLTSGVWSLVYSSNNQLSRAIVTEGVSKQLSLGLLTGYAPGIGQGTMTTLAIPMSMTVSTGQVVDFSLLAPIRASAIPYGGPASFDYSLSVGGVSSSIAVNADYTADIILNGAGSGTYTSTPLSVPLTATATIRRNSPSGIPEPGAISLLALGGLAMGGTLLRRKSR